MTFLKGSDPDSRMDARYCLSVSAHSQKLTLHRAACAVAMPRKPRIKTYSARFKDYPVTMSGWERESFAAEAQLKAERAERTKKKRPKRR